MRGDARAPRTRLNLCTLRRARTNCTGANPSPHRALRVRVVAVSPVGAWCNRYILAWVIESKQISVAYNI